MRLSVVIPAHNEEHTIPRQLEALLNQTWEHEWEVVVVDNDSTDRTAEVVTRMGMQHPRLRLISESQRGLCHARNAGIGAAKASAIAICDADDIVGTGWVAAMGDMLAKHEIVTGPHELNRLNAGWLAASRGRPDAMAAPSFHKIFAYPNGNNFGLHRSVVDRLGGFDQRYIGAEDVEFGLRAWRAGISIHFEANAKVYYAFRSTGGELWRQGLGYGKPRPAVAKALAACGEERPARLAGWKSWAWLGVNVWRVFSAQGRARWLWVAGNRVGHLVGSVRERTVLL